MKLLLFFLCIATFSLQGESNDQPFRTRIVVNPKAGTASKNSIERVLLTKLDPSFNPEVIYTQGPNHATLLSKEAVSLGYNLVIAVGGDGTINEVGKGLIGSGIPLGIIASGSGNGLARHLNLPLDVEKAIKVINQFKTKLIDTVRINEDFFLGIAGIGFDAHIAKEFSKSKERGFFSYAALVLKEYSSYSAPVLDLQIDGKMVKKQGFLISFANSSQYGNEIKIAPHAKLDDGHLHLVILKKPPIYALLGTFLKLRKGIIRSSSYYESICCTDINIPTKNLLAHIDGEPALFENGMHIKVVPGSLKVVVSE